MDVLPGWENAPALILSCPGTLRRHSCALLPYGEVTLPQVLLGGESQLAAFAAAATGMAGKLFFAPMPEMFADPDSLHHALRLAGGPPGARPVHLRFGGVRAARVLKGFRNGCVVAEAAEPLPLSASHHPFASGMVLPAAIGRLYVYGPEMRRPRGIGGAAIPASRLPANCITADLPTGTGLTVPGKLAKAGLDLVSLADFRSLPWAAGPVRARTAPALLAAGGGVLLPWNMDHPGSIVPDLLIRLSRLAAQADAPLPNIVLAPFNYVGQTGIIRRLVARLREAAHDADAFMAAVFLVRVASLDAIPALTGLTPVAWVDGNDPEAWWTLARLRHCGLPSILIDPHTGSGDHELRVAADEAVWVEAETRFGVMTVAARLPSLRALPGLLALSASRGAGKPPAAPDKLRRAPARPLPDRPGSRAAVS